LSGFFSVEEQASQDKCFFKSLQYGPSFIFQLGLLLYGGGDETNTDNQSWKDLTFTYYQAA